MAATGVELPIDQAAPIADAIVEQLRPYCERIAIAGSIRRRAAVVHDVELVVIPAHWQQVVALPGFDDLPTAPLLDALDAYLNDLEHHAEIRKRRDRNGRTFWGPSDKRILWRYGAASDAWIPLDVFGATTATWGAKLALRTGPVHLSKALVTPRLKGGLLPDDLEFRSGGLYRFDSQSGRHARSFVPTPDEETLFRELGLPMVPPEWRTPGVYLAAIRGQR